MASAADVHRLYAAIQHKYLSIKRLQNVTESSSVVERMNTVIWPIGGTQVFFRLSDQ
jgi:hypothetical protein